MVRQEADGIRRYCHLATGNYNVRTGGIYGDFGLFTCRESIGEDVTELFNMLTGYTRPRRFRHLLVAPDRAAGRASAAHPPRGRARPRGRPARIVAKMNSLVDRTLIEELYAASQAGVAIDLIVRGICCLRPGVPGFSDRIRVISIVDRYLEHARVYYFHNGGAPEYCAGLGGLDAAEPRPSRRDRVPDPRPAPAVADPRGARDPAHRHLQGARDPDRRQLDPRPRARGAPLRSQERLYGLVSAESRTS